MPGAALERPTIPLPPGGRPARLPPPSSDIDLELFRPGEAAVAQPRGEVLPAPPAPVTTPMAPPPIRPSTQEKGKAPAFQPTAPFPQPPPPPLGSSHWRPAIPAEPSVGDPTEEERRGTDQATAQLV